MQRQHELLLCPVTAVRAGRQELTYPDARMHGNDDATKYNAALDAAAYLY
ncbi:MAG TPA: hypothetical protein VJR90_04880 [Gammaproteobacteria bacterium]|nr:hypothetical protein [Gammaproteobacteria bacterium]